MVVTVLHKGVFPGTFDANRHPRAGAGETRLNPATGKQIRPGEFAPGHGAATTTPARPTPNVTDLPPLPAASLDDLLEGNDAVQAAVGAATTHLLQEQVEHNTRLGLRWSSVQHTAAHVWDHVKEKFDLRSTARELRALGKEHGPAFMAYAIAIEAFEDLVVPAFLTAVGKPALIPFALAFHTEPVLYPLYFAVSKWRKQRAQSRQEFTKSVRAARRALRKAIDRRGGALNLILSFDEARHPRAARGAIGHYHGGEFVPASAAATPLVTVTRLLTFAPLTEKALRRIAAREQASHHLRYEYGFAVSPAGTILFDAAGTEDTIEVPLKAQAKLARAGGAVFTHNHPGGWAYPPDHPGRKGNSFSKEDIQVACNCRLAEMRATSPGYVHSMKPGPGGWDWRTWEEQVEPVYAMFDRIVHAEQGAQILQNKLTTQQAEANHFHLIWSRVAPVLGWHYTRTEIPPA